MKKKKKKKMKKKKKKKKKKKNRKLNARGTASPPRRCIEARNDYGGQPTQSAGHGP